MFTFDQVYKIVSLIMKKIHNPHVSNGPPLKYDVTNVTSYIYIKVNCSSSNYIYIFSWGPCRSKPTFIKLKALQLLQLSYCYLTKSFVLGPIDSMFISRVH